MSKITAPHEILHELRVRGWTLDITESGSLAIGPSEKLTPKLLEKLIPHKEGLIQCLQNEREADRAEDMGRVVELANATFPKSKSNDDPYEEYWNNWRKLVARYFTGSMENRLEAACEWLPKLISIMMNNGDHTGLIPARYCYGRLQAIVDGLTNKNTDRG